MTTAVGYQKRLQKEWIERVILGITFVLIGTLIIVVFSPYRPVFTGFVDTIGRLILIDLLLTTALVFKKFVALNRYWRVLFGLFVLILVVSLDYWAAGFIQNILGIQSNTPSAIAFEKVKSAGIAALVVLFLTKVSGESMGSVYVQRGKLFTSLAIGLATFLIAAAGAIPVSQLLFSGKSVAMADLLRWVPWLFIFVLGNAFFEELLFRGLFLRKLEPFYGKFISNCLIILVFTGLHLGVTYTRDQMLFLVILIPLAFLWGYIMQKTETIWGSVLFHAGMDLPIALALLSTL
jgi:membrane protease YdiL (CAAX protease family)